jgi:phage-related protein
MPNDPPLKPVIWLGTSLKNLREFPPPVQDHMGYALYIAQSGSKHEDAKVLRGFGGACVLEVIRDYRGDTFRAVYTLKYSGRVCAACLPEKIEEWRANSGPGH